MSKKQWSAIGVAMSVGTGLAMTAPMASAQGAQMLEEIVVTARKRSESLQDVGLAVSAMSKTEIERTFARDIQDLASISPNLIIDDTAQGPGGVAAIFIRGVGVADVEKNFDPAVGVVVDGIFLGANAGSLLRSIDLASVEVLRGPQGTLFGRNTIGGLINITHTQPTGELGAKVRAGVESYDTYYLDAVVNFGLTDDLAAKVTLGKRDQQEGYYDNVTVPGDGEGENDYETYAINMLWNASDNLEFEISYQHEEIEQHTPPLLNTGQDHHFFCFGYGYCSPSLDKPITGDRLEVANQGFLPAGEPSNASNPFVVTSMDDIVAVPLDASFETDSWSFETRWNINDSYRVDYLYGHWESDEEILSNWDGTPELLYGTTRPASYEQDSHELRLTYDAGNKLSFVAGGYYWKSEYEMDLRSHIGFNGDFPNQVLDIYQHTIQETDSWAVFFEGDYAVTDALTLTLGGRYTEDEKESQQDGAQGSSIDPVTGEYAAEEWDEFTPRVGARYAINEDVMVFATYSKGYRSGGFNGRVDGNESASQPYDPETVDNYEMGIKSEWMDNRLRVNANLFYMEYDDKQEELQLPSDTSTGQKTVVTNASTATIQGIEIDLQAFISENLSLRANLGYLDTEYDDFVYEGVGGTVDLSHLEFRRAPEWTASLDATYEWDMAGGNAWVRGAYHFLGEHYVNVTNSPELENDDQHLIDASINYAINSFQFSLFGRNLTDEDGYTHGYDVAGLWSYASTRAPLTYGFEVIYNFGGE